jgi:hypothetical protein
MLEREGDPRPGTASRASAHRVHDYHQRAARLLDGSIHISRRSQLADAEPRQFFAHGTDERFRVGHASLLSMSLDES